MCIRDSYYKTTWYQCKCTTSQRFNTIPYDQDRQCTEKRRKELYPEYGICLLYTSDAADERSSVDLGGRRIIKKKKKEKVTGSHQK